MTAVARFRVGHQPVLIGDLMVSGSRVSKSLSSLPTVHTEDVRRHFQNEETNVPRSLVQKIAILSDYMMIGWSGRVTAVHDLLGELVMRIAHERFDMERLNEYFDNQPSSVWGELGVMGFVLDPDRRLAMFGRSYEKYIHNSLGKIGLPGFGSDAFQRHLDSQGQHLSDIGSQITNAAARAFATALAATAGLHSAEVMFGSNLKELFGGGYEVASMDGLSFRKLGEVTFVFWKASFDGKNRVGVGVMPVRAIKYQLEGEVVYIRAVEFNKIPNG